MKKIYIMTICGVFSVTQFAVGQSLQQGTTVQGPTQTQVNRGIANSVFGIIGGTSSSSDTEKESGKAIKDAVVTTAKSVTVAAVMDKKCSASSSFGGYIFCAMAISAGAQAVESALTGKGSRRTNSQVLCGGRACGITGYDVNGNPVYEAPDDKNDSGGFTNPNSNVDNLLDRYRRESQNIVSALGKRGYSLNSDGSVTTPKGRVSPDDLSPGSMAAAGFSPSEIADFQKTMADAMKKGESEAARLAKLLDKNMAAAGGSVDIKNKKFVGEDGFDMNKYLRGLEGGRGPASAEPFAGLSKNMGNDSIGVSGDNIFKMINRQYKNQTDKGQFLPK